MYRFHSTARWADGFAIVLALLFASSTISAVGQTQPATSPAGQEYRHALDPAPQGLDHARFELWLPGTVSADESIRAVILSPLYQADTRIYELPQWRQFAAHRHIAMLRHDMRTTVDGRKDRLPIGRDALAAIEQALAHFARQTGHPELSQAPYVITGLSQGGMQTTRLTLLAPERVAAAVPFHGASLDAYAPNTPEAARARQVPMLIVLGQRDDLTMRVLGELPAAQRQRPLWTVLMQPNVPHHILGDPQFILAWLDEILQRRLPADVPPAGQPVRLKDLSWEESWLGTYRLSAGLSASDIRIRRAADVRDDQTQGAWLSDEPMAQAWQLAMLTGLVQDHEQREEVAAEARPADKPIVVDGNLDEWGELAHEFRWPAQVLPTGLNWHGPDDSSARFDLAFDDGYLYIAARVIDDDGLYQGKAPWAQDGLEVRIDARPAPLRMSNTGRGEGTDFLLVGVGPGPGPNDAFAANRESLPDGTRIAATHDATGYRVEIAVPSEYLDRAQGARWSRFRLNLTIDDPDPTGKSQLWWRPDWRSEQSEFGSGTVARRAP